MALTKIKLGELIEISNEKNTDLKYSLEDVKGISIKKMFIETKADMQDVSLSPYLLVKPDYFAYVTITSRNGEKITLAYNDTNNTYIVSSSYIVFKVKRPDLLSSNYLFMYFNRPEFDRYSRFNSWGSAREAFSWEDMCDIEMELPDLPTQQKYVDIYNAMIANQKAYEKGLDDLKLVCDAYIEDLRRKMPCEEIGSYIIEVSKKNKDLDILTVQGVDSTSRFVGTKANLQGVDLTKYKIVEKGFFVYNPSRINLGSIALKTHGNCIVSPMYEIFKINDTNKLLPEYLFTWLTRAEFLRSTLFYAIGSVRDTFDLELMRQVSIPIPKIETQRSIVNIYKCYTERKDINERLKNQIKDICPILIKGAIEEGKQQ